MRDVSSCYHLCILAFVIIITSLFLFLMLKKNNEACHITAKTERSNSLSGTLSHCSEIIDYYTVAVTLPINDK